MYIQKGFTLIELVVMIVILGILSAVAVPNLIDIRNEAEASSADGVFGAAQSAAALNHAAKLCGKAAADRPAYHASNCSGALIVNGACLMEAMDGIPDGWVAAGSDICLDSTGDGACGDETYIISVATAETGTVKTILTKNW